MMITIAFFQREGLNCNVLISDLQQWLEVKGGWYWGAGANSLIQISLLFPIATPKASAATP